MKYAGEIKQNMTTLSECVTNAFESGYVENFRVDNGMLATADGKSLYHYYNIFIVNSYRFNGNDSAGTDCILYLVQTMDGRKGTLIDLYTNPEFSNFLQHGVDIHNQKKNTQKKSMKPRDPRLKKLCSAK
jgi:hypothetical protein